MTAAHFIWFHTSLPVYLNPSPLGFTLLLPTLFLMITSTLLFSYTYTFHCCSVNAS